MGGLTRTNVDDSSASFIPPTEAWLVLNGSIMNVAIMNTVRLQFFIAQ